MITSSPDTLLVTLDLDIGFFHFYPNLIVSEIKEGVNVNFNNAIPVFMRGLDYYTPETPLVFISDRKKSHSFDPTVHLDAKEFFSNLKGYAVVVYDDINLRIATLEQQFISCPLKVFHSLEEAKEWATRLLKQR